MLNANNHRTFIEGYGLGVPQILWQVKKKRVKLEEYILKDILKRNKHNFNLKESFKWKLPYQ